MWTRRVRRAVQRVPLHRLAAGFADQLQQFRAAQALHRGGAGIVIDPLFHDGAVDVVGAEAQRDLRDPRGHHHPIGFDVRDVVEHQPRHRDVADVGEPGGLRDVLQRACYRDGMPAG